MDSADDKQWASKYLLDPLTAPEPSQETGPGTHYNSTFSPTNPFASASSNSPTTSHHSSDKKSEVFANVAETGTKSRNPYPTPPHSAGPRRSQFSEPPSSNRFSTASTQVPTSTNGTAGGRHRNNSLPSRQRPVDPDSPLDIVRRDTKLAYRSPHLRKKHIPGPDTIDTLDTVGGGYHHEGPYDATLWARNTNYKSSPIEAVKGTNQEALKATPEEKIQDSLRKHMPLDGTAAVPPGIPDREGRVYNYEEGTDMMVENGGNYKRWPSVTYLPEDLKGKGEPSYSIEKALKEHKRSQHRRNTSAPLNTDAHNEEPGAIELQTSPQSPHYPRDTAHSPRYRDSIGSEGRRSVDSNRPLSDSGQRYTDWESGLRRSGSGAKGVSGSIRRRFGSLRRRS